jgi:hypothetical protein
MKTCGASLIAEGKYSAGFRAKHWVLRSRLCAISSPAPGQAKGGFHLPVLHFIVPLACRGGGAV